MSTDEMSEKQAFDSFVAQQLGGELKGLSLEEALAQFRQYQRDLDQIRAKLSNAEDQYDRGEAKPLNDATFRDNLDARMDERGIPK